MFPASKIDPFCQKCHKTHNVPAKQIISHWQTAYITVSDVGSITCTHCHGQHRIGVRTVVWDKATGELLPNEQ